MAKLVVISRSQAGLAHRLGKQWVTIGRGPGNAFQILESSISGQHCEVLLQGNEVVVRDMRSTNGTFINGTLITEGVLKMREVLRLGEVELRLEPAELKDTVPVVPVLGGEQETKAPATPQVPSAGCFGAKQHQVLLVDDSMAFLEMAGELFEQFANGAWKIHRACGADQALSIIQLQPIEIVVLDINMPMLDGMQLLGMIHRRHPELKKVILTGHGNDNNRGHCLAAGAELFLEKPVTPGGMRSVFNVLNDLLIWNEREGFSGTMQQVGLTDLIQIECLRRNSCILEIQTARAQGEIYIESGMIVHAVTGGVSGEKGLHRLLSLNNGQFYFYPYREPAQRTIHDSWESLLMESAQARDEEMGALAADETTVIRRLEAVAKPEPVQNTNGHVKPEPPPAESKEPEPAGDLDLPELGNGIVIVSTYDGKWNPVDGE